MSIKSKKGITLAILVITIVVMLIIAGTSVSMIFSGSGILNNAREIENAQKNYAYNEETKTNSLINDLDEEMNNTN